MSFFGHFKGTHAPDLFRAWRGLQMHVGFVFKQTKPHLIFAPGVGLKHDHVLQALLPHGEHCSFLPHIKLAHVNPTKNCVKNRILKLWNY